MMDRRRALKFAAGLAAVPLALPARGTGLAPTPACPGEGATPSQTEGPFYTPRTPLKTSFLADADGERLTLQGYVLDTRCTPLPGTWIDLWHADALGAYDNTGFRLRGHQFTDAGGRYRFETIVPGLYPGRTRHFHVKLRAPGAGRVLTTQLYFPDEPGNARDGLFRSELVLRLERAAHVARFDFVLET
jgi:protocatechuate 3,4-dioxygenase beta subunit